MAKVVLTYFPLKARLGVIVLLLEDQQIPYEFDPVERAKWPEMKQKGLEDGTLPFGQVPQLKDGDLYLVQSLAILRYLARKHGLYGKDSVEAAKCDMYAEGITDLRNDAMKLFYSDLPKAIEDIKATTFPKHGAYFEGILNRGGTDYLVGNTVTFADYMLVDLLENLTEVAPEILEPFPLLKAYYNRFQARPHLVAYRASGRELPSWYSWKKSQAAS
eukprot:CAMPEP_0196666418 /NCGR_PEP_ID=MMETSP1086-20130531/64500_1 /TAXON_ID=77921 /ORGANISM="Cyanoptyche  gloeocystis , Strain SAG4.97" /LENGTH=216 /DNA_ID=CAMNT_0042003607 /DNA_START=78 /DNA_END=728 /DNA_ORIENTATION=+